VPGSIFITRRDSNPAGASSVERGRIYFNPESLCGALLHPRDGQELQDLDYRPRRLELGDPRGASLHHDGVAERLPGVDARSINLPDGTVVDVSFDFTPIGSERSTPGRTGTVRAPSPAPGARASPCVARSSRLAGAGGGAIR
jgi:hypothetical protein